MPLHALSDRSARTVSVGQPNTADKLRSARSCTTPHDTHPTAERTEHHATPPHSPRFVSFIRLLGGPARTTSVESWSPGVTTFHET